jgi:hypothetical protein
MRAATMLASAPVAARRPLQTRRLTISLSTSSNLSPCEVGSKPRQRGSKPSQMVVTRRSRAWSKSASEAGIVPKIQPESSCSIAP